MQQIKDPCPYDVAVRASQCVPCNQANGPVPPCVRAFLSGRDVGKVIVLVQRPERRAA